jgi:8-amino-7-oxononanoate synthase
MNYHSERVETRRMLDFTSALYLGMRHPSASLRPWQQLTTGVPAALKTPSRARLTAERLAALQGCESATLAPSTLHLVWDLLEVLVNSASVIYPDSGVYPVMRWGVERAAAKGVRVRGFRHYDAEALRRELKAAARGTRPLVLTDGYCPACGRVAPLAEYLESIRAYGGRLILDDTQALGIFGYRPNRNAPYGREGGGAMRYREISGREVLVLSSLAKGFGAPLAVLSGSRRTIRRFEDESETRVHCSPPSLAAVHAAEQALETNRRCGDELRLRLARRVSYFRQRLKESGFLTVGGLFPVQTLALNPALDPLKLYAYLSRMGIKTVLQRGQHNEGARLTFVINALHSEYELDLVTDALTTATRM